MSISRATISLSLLLAALPLAASPAFAGTTSTAAPNGQNLYQQNCAMCHGNDGKGSVPGTPDFTKPGGTLAQSDDLLVQRVLNGYSSPGSQMAMPPMKSQLDASQVKAILDYMHKAFGVPSGK